jgi:hypothetical protein
MAAWVQVSSAVHSMLLFVCFWHRAIGTAAFFLALALTGCLLQYSLLPLSQHYYLDQEHIQSTGSRPQICSCDHFALLYEIKTLFSVVMQEWQKLGPEYVASKHYPKSLHRLAAAL